MDSEAGDANATLDLLEALTGNKDLKPQDLDAVKQLLEIAAVQKADGARLQAMTARYSTLKTQGVAVSTTPARPALTLDYSGDSLDDISGVKGCGDAQTAQTTACFAAFNKALKADYTALKQYNLALGWSAQRFQPDALQAKASKACGRFDYCPTTTLYVMNQTLLHETNEVRFPRPTSRRCINCSLCRWPLCSARKRPTMKRQCRPTSSRPASNAMPTANAPVSRRTPWSSTRCAWMR
ncbi:hypothetical protein NWF32_23930 [Pseudomonas qingdaonensis]|nr:hypothetical protein [Pseudomonas qingdaonensis]